MSLPSSRHTLPAVAFPFVMIAISVETGAEVWRRRVTGPDKVFVPPLAERIGGPVRIIIEWPDGTTTT